MKTKTVNALLWPLDNAVISLPSDSQGIFLNALSNPVLSSLKGRLLCVQGRRPDYLALEAQGMSVSRNLPGEQSFSNEQGKIIPPSESNVVNTFDFVLCALSKHKAQAQAEIAQGLLLLKPGGYLICAGRNDTGAASLAKAAQKLGDVSVQSKYHHRVFWIKRQADKLPNLCYEWMDGGRLQFVDTIHAVSAPAVFGWNKVDKGSQLLAEQFNDRIYGHVVDLGSGWGYLSREVLTRCPKVSEITMIDAESLAVEASTMNMKPFELSHTVQCLWQDVASDVNVRLANCVVMNPAFHSGKDTDMELGFAFIRTARKVLRPGGALLMVANRHLPYESELSKVFKKHEKIAETAAFKVIRAIA